MYLAAMRAVVLADCHIDHNRHNLHAFDAWTEATTWVADHEVDVVVIAGDTFNTGRVLGPALNVANDGLRRMGAAGCEVVLIAGNHEWIGVPRPSQSKSLLIEAQVDVTGVSVATATAKHVRLASGCHVAALPWHQPGLEGSQQQSADMLADSFTGLSPDEPRLLAAHAAIGGTTVQLPRGSEIDLAMLTDEPTLPLAAVNRPELFSFSALGHIHNRQELAPDCWYVGSNDQMTFADTNTIKGFSVLDWVQLPDGTYGWEHYHQPTTTGHLFCVITLNPNRRPAVEEIEAELELLDQPGAQVKFVLQQGATLPPEGIEMVESAGHHYRGFSVEAEAQSHAELSERLAAARSASQVEISREQLLERWAEREQIDDSGKALMVEPAERLYGWRLPEEWRTPGVGRLNIAQKVDEELELDEEEDALYDAIFRNVERAASEQPAAVETEEDDGADL